ncbi:MAG: hypothetical protein IJM90_00270 [Firmicutes bacterium]|nr:hypothetical protein [Bacillota bacterium]
MLRQIVHCMGISYRRLFSQAKFWLVLALVILFTGYQYLPLNHVSSFYKVPMVPWTLPFYLSMLNMQIVFGGLIMILFEDVFWQDVITGYVISRVGKRNYIIAQVLYVLATSFLFVLFLQLLTWIMLLPSLAWDDDWGVLLRTIAAHASEITNQTGEKLSFVIDEELIHLMSPVKASIASFISMWLVAAFMGLLMGVFSLFVGQSSGTIAAGLVIVMGILPHSIMYVILGKTIWYFAPFSWASINALDWYYSGMTPSPSFGLAVLSGSIAVFSTVLIIRFSRKDLE